MNPVEAALPWFCGATVILSVVAPLIATRNPKRRADLQLNLFVYPKAHIAFAVAAILVTAPTLIVGIIIIAAPNPVDPIWPPIGWGLIALAASPLFPIAYGIHLEGQFRASRRKTVEK